MIDLADLVLRRDGKIQSNSRLKIMSANVLAFALGCAAAALLSMQFGVGCSVIPPILACSSLIVRAAKPTER